MCYLLLLVLFVRNFLSPERAKSRNANSFAYWKEEGQGQLNIIKVEHYFTFILFNGGEIFSCFLGISERAWEQSSWTKTANSSPHFNIMRF